MSRTIKFRAWHDGKMCPVYLLEFNETEQNPCILEVITDLNKDIVRRIPASELDTAKLMQFTGLNDCNGKEIYESDICQIDGETHEVYWNEDRWGLQEVSPKPGCRLKFDYDNGDFYQGHEIDWTKCEVVGNVHESKEHNEHN